MSIRRIEPGNTAEALGHIFAGPRVVSGTPPFPYPSVEVWHRGLSEPFENAYSLVGVSKGKVLGKLNLVGEMETIGKRPAGRVRSGAAE